MVMLYSIWIYIADSFTGAYSPYLHMTNGKAEEEHMILHLLEGNYMQSSMVGYAYTQQSRAVEANLTQGGIPICVILVNARHLWGEPERECVFRLVDVITTVWE